MSSFRGKKVITFINEPCPTLCKPMDCSPPSSSVHGILQARILEWIAMPFSRGSSQFRDRTCISCKAGRFFTAKPWESKGHLKTFPTFLLFDVGINTTNFKRCNIFTNASSEFRTNSKNKFPREVLKIHFWKRMSVFIFPVYKTFTNHLASDHVYRGEKHPQNK